MKKLMLAGAILAATTATPIVKAESTPEGHLSGFHCHTALLDGRLGGYTKCYKVYRIKWRLRVDCYVNSKLAGSVVIVRTYYIGHNGEISKLCPNYAPYAYSARVEWYAY